MSYEIHDLVGNAGVLLICLVGLARILAERQVR